MSEQTLALVGEIEYLTGTNPWDLIEILGGMDPEEAFYVMQRVKQQTMQELMTRAFPDKGGSE